jgi:hypothetical protein
VPKVESRIELLVAGTAAGAEQVLAGLRRRRSMLGSWAADLESAAEDIDLEAIGGVEPGAIVRAGSLEGLAQEGTGSCAVGLARTAEGVHTAIVHIALGAAAGSDKPAVRVREEAIDSSAVDQARIVEVEVKSIVGGEGIGSTAASVVLEPG